MRRTEGATARTQAQQVLMGSYTVNKQVIEDWFTTVGVTAGTDKEAITVLKGQALNDFWKMTKGGREGGVDPNEALPVVMQKYRSVGTGVATTLISQVPKQYQQNPRLLKKDYESGRVKPDDYKRWSTFLVNANDIVPMAEWETMNAPPPAPTAKPPTPPAMTGGRRAPKP